MLLNLDYRSAKPLYEQIKDGLKKLILSGILADGEKLPSVRELSTQLALNPNTIQRAYRELEGEGIICSVGGRGSFVAERGSLRQRREAELLELLEKTLRELRELGISKETLKESWEAWMHD